MHCPSCGQQQISHETKFCSRCGFQLGLVSELLSQGGFLPQLAELNKGKGSLFSRRNGIIFTILWFIFFVMMVPAFFGIADIEELAAISAVFGIFTTLMLLVVSVGFLRSAPRAFELPGADGKSFKPAGLHGSVRVPELPPQQNQPASSYIPPNTDWRAPDTGDLVRPGSVIEGTTKLLKKDQPQ